MSDARSYVTDDWTADQWEAARAKAAAWLARDPGWKVGSEVVAFYTRGRDRLLAAQA